MSGRPIRHAFTNVVCSFVPGRARRRRLRVIMNSPVLMYLHFIRRDVGARLFNIRFLVGFRAKSLLIAVNNKYVYKFPLRHKNYREMAIREKRIVDEMRKISPIYIPPVRLMEYRGILIRRYDFVPGAGIRQLPADFVVRHRDAWARQIARFIDKIARTDPIAIRDLKPDSNIRPGFARGWYHWDVFDNIMIDANTGKIIAMIDWEDCQFGDFSPALNSAREKNVCDFMRRVADFYKKIAGENPF